MPSCMLGYTTCERWTNIPFGCDDLPAGREEIFQMSSGLFVVLTVNLAFQHLLLPENGFHIVYRVEGWSLDIVGGPLSACTAEMWVD